MTAHESAQALLDDLIAAAQRGDIIPVRLPGQLEAIKEALASAEAEAEAAANAAPPAPEVPADVAETLKEQAAFVSHAVHELRTPMTSIRGYSDMLVSMGELNDMQKQFVETIRTNARRMEGLLTDVSDVSKLKGDTLRINLKMDTFKNVIMMVEKAVTATAEQLGRRLTFEIPSGLPILNVDGELLAKALAKLVENALRYSPADPEGDVQGEVTVRASGEGSRLTVQISDNGVGMTPDDIARLGEFYFRADNDVVRAHKGSGLGIPVAYGIIRLHDGVINVDSTPNGGTTFTITLTGMT